MTKIHTTINERGTVWLKNRLIFVGSVFEVVTH